MNTHATAYLVRQVGARNYAGPNCPGVGWNCTTSTRVLQIATTASGTNSAACTTQTCSISQSGSSNTARCSQSSSAASATQSCTINQTGATNYAFVAQTISQSAGANCESKRNPPAQLDLTPGVHGHGDGAELRRVHKPIGRAQVSVVEPVEEFSAELRDLKRRLELPCYAWYPYETMTAVPMICAMSAAL